MSGAEIVQVIASVSELARISLRLYQFLNRLKKADANALETYRRIRHLHEVVNGVELALVSRKEQVEPPKHAHHRERLVWGYIDTSASRCHSILLQIRTLYTAFSIEEKPGLIEKAIRQFRLDIIKKEDLLEHYSALSTQIQALNVNLQTLNTFISIGTIDRVEDSREKILEAITKLSIAHQKGNQRLEKLLDTPPTRRRFSSIGVAPSSSSQDAIIRQSAIPNDVETMQGTLKTAIDVITEYEPEPGSVMGRLDSITQDASDSGFESDEDDECDLPSEQKTSEISPPRPRSGSTVQHLHETSRFVLDGYIRNYEKRVENALEKDQVHTAEPDLRKLMEYAQERKLKYDVPFNRVQMQEQLARIYKQQGKYEEAIAVLSELLPERGTTVKHSLENSRHFQIIAETYYELWTATDQHEDLEAACDHVRTAFTIREKELDLEHELLQESAKLIADVYEALNFPAEAQVYRELVQAPDLAEDPPIYPRLDQDDGEIEVLEGDIDVNEALIPTIKAGNIGKLRALLKSKNIDLEQRGSQNWTPLMYAFKYSNGSESMPLALLNRGFAIDAYDNAGRTVLHQAAARSDPMMIRLAIQRDAAKEEKDAHKMTPLLVAVKEGHQNKRSWKAAVKALLDEQCDSRARDENLWTVLHHAAHNCATNHGPAAEQVLEFLLERRQLRAIEAEDRQGYSPLLRVAGSGDPKTVSILLKHDADPNAINNAGRSALYLAMYKKPHLPKYANVIKLLVDAGAEINEGDYSKEDFEKFREAIESGQKRRASDHSRRSSAGKESLRQLEKVNSMDTVLTGESTEGKVVENEANIKKPRRRVMKFLNLSRDKVAPN